MAMRRATVILALVACGGGAAGNPEMATDAYESPGPVRDAPGTTRDPADDREPPPPSRDAPPPSQDPAPSGGGGASAGTCLGCENQTYTCTGFIEGLPVTQGVDVELRDLDGHCVTVDDQNGLIVTTTFACGGKILNASGIAIGTWSNASGGGFAAALEGIQLTCTPKPSTPGGPLDAGAAPDGA